MRLGTAEKADATDDVEVETAKKDLASADGSSMVSYPPASRIGVCSVTGAVFAAFAAAWSTVNWIACAAGRVRK